jgi:hypothetical protein
MFLQDGGPAVPAGVWKLRRKAEIPELPVFLPVETSEGLVFTDKDSPHN